MTRAEYVLHTFIEAVPLYVKDFTRLINGMASYLTLTACTNLELLVFSPKKYVEHSTEVNRVIVNAPQSINCFGCILILFRTCICIIVLIHFRFIFLSHFYNHLYVSQSQAIIFRLILFKM